MNHRWMAAGNVNTPDTVKDAIYQARSDFAILNCFAIRRKEGALVDVWQLRCG